MYPRHHILAGFLFSLLVLALFPGIGFFNASLIFLASFLIDIDHYIYYVSVKQNLSLKKALLWFSGNLEKTLKLPREKRKSIYCGLYSFHGLEAILILILLSFFNEVFFFIALGFIFHQILDLIEIIDLGVSPDKVISFIYSIKKARYKKRISSYKSK